MLLLFALSLAGCKEDSLETYSGENYVHFEPDANDVVSASYNFALGETTREERYDIPVPVRLWGFLPDEDFTFTTEIVSEGTTALPSDYAAPQPQVFRKGEPSGTFFLTVYRRPELLATDFTIVVKMVSAENHVVAPSCYASLTIKVTDDLSGSRPVWWNTTPALGEYSDVKFRIFNIYLGRFLQKLDGYSQIAFKNEALKFKAWWKEQWDEGNYRYYDSDNITPLYETIPD